MIGEKLKEQLPEATQLDGTVYHVVLLWLKEPGNAELTDKIIELSKQFEKIPGVMRVTAGRKLASKRPIVDSSFDIGMVMVFPNVKTMNEYLTHPVHVNAVDTVLKPYVDKILVYDIVE